MKKSVDILGLPVISITEGRELGMSKTLLIDAPNRIVAAITIDAVTINNSENILTLDAAGDFETLLDDNIRVIGTKAITRTGVIQGNITEIFIGEDGSIEKCEVTTPEGSTSEVTADQVAIFGKEVTVISPEGDAAKKSDAASAPAAPAVTAPAAEPAAAEPVEETAPLEEMPGEEPAAPEETAAPEAPAEEPAPAAEEPAPEAPADEAKDAERANEDRHRRFLLGKKATRTIKMDNGVVIVEAGADITEEVLQKAKLGNKFIELSMSAQ